MGSKSSTTDLEDKRITVYVFGNGNVSFETFLSSYAAAIDPLVGDPNCSFAVGDFRGVDTLTLEFLKCRTPRVTLFHVGEKARYLPDRFRTFVDQWSVIGGFESDRTRDDAAIAASSHFLAIDGNSDKNRKSGTARNIEECFKRGLTRIETTVAGIATGR